jgi:hypothetical protein
LEFFKVVVVSVYSTDLFINEKSELLPRKLMLLHSLFMLQRRYDQLTMKIKRKRKNKMV